jgi:hypothetical protein
VLGGNPYSAARRPRARVRWPPVTPGGARAAGADARPAPAAREHGRRPAARRGRRRWARRIRAGAWAARRVRHGRGGRPGGPRSSLPLLWCACCRGRGSDLVFGARGPRSAAPVGMRNVMVFVGGGRRGLENSRTGVCGHAPGRWPDFDQRYLRQYLSNLPQTRAYELAGGAYPAYRSGILGFTGRGSTAGTVESYLLYNMV